jgi:CRISPR/Cas system-associated exonuclease Cas4 (RecB family)
MISKSSFILGQQCYKSFWFDINNKEPTNPPDEGALERLSAGNEVGEISKELFPNGKEVPYFPGEPLKMAMLTKEYIEDGITSIYEASFIYDDIFVRVDLMNKTDKGWDIYEVKSSTRIRRYHEYDVSIQWHVLKSLNLIELNDAFIVTLNNQFSKSNRINPIKLFNIDSVKQIAEENQPEVIEKIHKLKSIAANQNEPKVKIGPHCKKPHSCVYFDKCWPRSADDIDSIFRFYRMNLDKKLNLYNKGVETFKQINPNESLNPIQKIQLIAYQKDGPVIDKKKIQNFIDKIQYPISYFDFETFTDAVPIYDSQRPHMQMPFQFSLHVQTTKDNTFNIDENHYGFIAKHDEDPRRAIAESMIKSFPKTGTIIAYNQSFEKNCIKSLAEYCPDLAEDLLSLNERFIDLIEPFRSGGYYDKEFRGSFSIKKVLPALCPNDSELDYKQLDISNGGMASSAFKEMRTQSIEHINLTRDKLFKYCRLDTYAMYAIYQKLIQI